MCSIATYAIIDRRNSSCNYWMQLVQQMALSPQQTCACSIKAGHLYVCRMDGDEWASGAGMQGRANSPRSETRVPVP